MFNKIYKLYKSPTLTTTDKQKNKIFLLKDMKQYKFEYINVINCMLGKNWPLNNKKISFNNLKLLKLFRYVFYLSLYYIIYITILF